MSDQKRDNTLSDLERMLADLDEKQRRELLRTFELAAAATPEMQLETEDAYRKIRDRIDSPLRTAQQTSGGLGLIHKFGYAAILVLGLLGGLLIRSDGPAEIQSAHTDSRYMLIVRNDLPPEVSDDLSLYQAYAQWGRELRENDRLVGADELALQAVLVSLSADGLQRERRQVGSASVAGYYMITAPDLETAVRLAAESPHVRYGGTMEVRPVVVRE